MALIGLIRGAQNAHPVNREQRHGQRHAPAEDELADGEVHEWPVGAACAVLPEGLDERLRPGGTVSCGGSLMLLEKMKLIERADAGADEDDLIVQREAEQRAGSGRRSER